MPTIYIKCNKEHIIQQKTWNIKYSYDDEKYKYTIGNFSYYIKIESRGGNDEQTKKDYVNDCISKAKQNVVNGLSQNALKYLRKKTKYGVKFYKDPYLTERLPNALTIAFQELYNTIARYDCSFIFDSYYQSCNKDHCFTKDTNFKTLNQYKEQFKNMNMNIITPTDKQFNKLQDDIKTQKNKVILKQGGIQINLYTIFNQNIAIKEIKQNLFNLTLYKENKFQFKCQNDSGEKSEDTEIEVQKINNVLFCPFCKTNKFLQQNYDTMNRIVQFGQYYVRLGKSYQEDYQTQNIKYKTYVITKLTDKYYQIDFENQKKAKQAINKNDCLDNQYCLLFVEKWLKVNKDNIKKYDCSNNISQYLFCIFTYNDSLKKYIANTNIGQLVLTQTNEVEITLKNNDSDKNFEYNFSSKILKSNITEFQKEFFGNQTDKIYQEGKTVFTDQFNNKLEQFNTQNINYTVNIKGLTTNLISGFLLQNQREEIQISYLDNNNSKIVYQTNKKPQNIVDQEYTSFENYQIQLMHRIMQSNKINQNYLNRILKKTIENTKLYMIYSNNCIYYGSKGTGSYTSNQNCYTLNFECGAFDNYNQSSTDIYYMHRLLQLKPSFPTDAKAAKFDIYYLKQTYQKWTEKNKNNEVIKLHIELKREENWLSNFTNIFDKHDEFKLSQFIDKNGTKVKIQNPTIGTGYYYLKASQQSRKLLRGDVTRYYFVIKFKEYVY